MADFENAVTSTVQMKIPLTYDGNIAVAGDTVTGTKLYSIEGISAGANLQTAAAVYRAFTIICNSSFDSLSAKKITNQGVVF